jgi:hypothetical protein
MRDIRDGITALSIVHSLCDVAQAAQAGRIDYPYTQTLSCDGLTCSECVLSEGRPEIGKLTEEDAMEILADIIDGFREANK